MDEYVVATVEAVCLKQKLPPENGYLVNKACFYCVNSYVKENLRRFNFTNLAQQLSI